MNSKFDKCIICENTEYVQIEHSSLIGLPVFKCLSCHLLLAGSTHDERQRISLKLYAKDYWDNQYSKYRPDENYTDHTSLGKKRDFVSQYSYVKKYLNNFKTCLEIGSGTGTTLFWLEQLECNVMGIEPDKRNVEMINKRLKHGMCINESAEKFKPNQNYDLIWINHVLEHSIRPDIILENLSKHLNISGLIMIEVPNCNNSNILYESIFNNPDNYHFTGDVLKRLVDKLGLKLVSIDYFRPAKKIEGVINKICCMIGQNPYKFYPRIKTSSKKGIAIRLLISKK